MKKLLLGIALALAPALALAEELKPAQEEAKASFTTALEDPVKALNEKCGTKVAIKADFENWKATDWPSASFYSYCQPVIDTIAAMCADRPAYKKVLAKKLTGIQCLFGGVKPKDKKDGSNEFTLRNMSFDKGVFTFHMHVDSANIADNTKATVEKALN